LQTKMEPTVLLTIKIQANAENLTQRSFNR
jgi:hypothetical protein